LARRTLLRGAKAAVALPLLECMLNAHGTALAQGIPLPRRLIVWFWGNGIIRSRWQPATTGAGWTLSPGLQPLSAVKGYVNVVTGSSVKIPSVLGHHNGCAGMLCGHPMVVVSKSSSSAYTKMGGPTIDQVAAPLMGATRFQSLQLRVDTMSELSDEAPTLTYVSHKGPDAPLPAMQSPAELYTKLFSGFTPPNSTPLPVDPRLALRRSVLDVVSEDTRRYMGKLGTSDRRRLDQHLTAISELRAQILAQETSSTGTTASTACTKPAAVTDGNTTHQYEQAHQLFANLMAVAFACDMTRVFSMQFSGSVANPIYKSVGLSSGSHTLSHDGDESQNHAMQVFTMKNLANLLEALKNTPEGSGNLLDQSVVYATTDIDNAFVHEEDDMPVLIAGRGGGSLPSAGIHYRSSGRNASDVLLTVLKAAGTGVTSVGSGTGASSSAISDLLV
jgi:hypothetical protein